MPEAGWLLLLLFLGCCSLIVIVLLKPLSLREVYLRRPPLATPRVSKPVASPAPIEDTPPLLPAPNSLPLAQWLDIVNDQPDDYPHTLIIGTSGTGKTTLAQAVASSRTDFLVILDPKWRPGRWGGLPAVPIDDDGNYTQIESAIVALLSELTGRLVSLKQGVTEFGQLTIIAEELPTVISECPSASLLIKRVGRLGRELRIRLVGISQSMRVKSLGLAGEGDALDNYTVIRLGKAAIKAVPEARLMTRPAILEQQGETSMIDVTGIMSLVSAPVAHTRAWPLLLPPPVAQPNEEKQDLLIETKQNSEYDTQPNFSLEEIGVVAALIAQDVEDGEAIRRMPRYNRRKHKAYSAYYEELKVGMKEQKTLLELVEETPSS